MSTRIEKRYKKLRKVKKERAVKFAFITAAKVAAGMAVGVATATIVGIAVNEEIETNKRKH